MAGNTIFADTPVRFDVAPATEREGRVFAQFHHDGRVYYILIYQAGHEPAFVVRDAGQFKLALETGHGRR